MGSRAEPLAPATVIRTLGRTDYVTTWEAMKAFTAARNQDTPDEIWLTEHPPVYTLGLAGRPEHLLRAGRVPLVKVDRGGQITYHGPGQLVAYVLIDLRRAHRGIRTLVRDIENAVIEFLALHGVKAWGKNEAPGVYVQRDGVEAKIAALGLKVSNGCTYHGLSLNVAMDLTPFTDINPCGYAGLAVTELAAFGVQRSVDEVGAELAPILVRRLTLPAPAEQQQPVTADAPTA